MSLIDGGYKKKNKHLFRSNNDVARILENTLEKPIINNIK